MNIQYEFTKEDYWNLNRDMIMMMPRMRSILLLVLIVSPVLFSFLLSYRFTVGVSILLSVLLLGLICLYIYFSVKAKVIRYAKSNPHVIGPRQLVVSAEGVQDESSEKTSFQQWSDIERIEDRKDHILLIIESATVICIPKHAFKDAHEASQFFQLASKYHQTA